MRGIEIGNKYEGNRDPRFVRIRNGGTLNNQSHQSFALWAAQCAEHVLYLFENQHPDDLRPAQAVKAARETKSASREVARAAGHDVATAHMVDHEIGAAFYALKAIKAAYPDQPEKMIEEREWQRNSLSSYIRELVLDDMV